MAGLVEQLVQHRQKRYVTQLVCSSGASVDEGCSPGPQECENKLFSFRKCAVCRVRCAQVNSDCSLVQKGVDCFWFGQPGRCVSWNILITTFVIAASVDSLLVLIMTLLGEKSSKSTRMKRYCSDQRSSELHAVRSCTELILVCRLFYAMEMVVIVCELLIAVCTLVHLFNLQHLVDSGVDEVLQNSRKNVALCFCHSLSHWQCWL